MVYIDFSKDFTFEELLERSLFVKFDVKEQLNNYGRIKQEGAIQFWKEQSVEAKKKSFYPDENLDVSVETGLGIIESYYNQHKTDEFIWTRGSFDQLAFESLYRAANNNKDAFMPFWMFRDIRTFIDLFKKSTNGYGYCNIPNFDKSKVIKHDPIHDIAYDAMMMKYGE